MQAAHTLASNSRRAAVSRVRVLFVWLFGVSDIRARTGIFCHRRLEMSVYARVAANWLSGFLVTLALLGLGACSIQLVADYDSTTYEEILRVGKKVDHFYGSLLEAPEKDRKYARYSEKYVEIETDLRSLYIRNKSRPLNQEATAISESILGLWMKYKQAHHDRDGYSTGIAKLDRNRFSRLFGSAADAEAAKRLDPEDRDARKDSK